MDNKDFYTFSEYMKRDNNLLTASMEDYLEMIYRLSIDNSYTRINELSSALNVQPSSASKMVQRMTELELLKYEKYGIIMLKEEGRKIGEELLKRHNIIYKFFTVLGISENSVLEETEKVEHVISDHTLKCIQNFSNFIQVNEDISIKYKTYLESLK